MIIEGEGIPGLVSLSYAEDLEVCYQSAMSFRKFKTLFQLVSMPQLLIQLQFCIM